MINIFTIKQAAEVLNISSSMIRYYDKEGLLPFIKKDENGYRQFSENDLFWLEFIRCMRATNMSISTLRLVAELYMQGNETLEKRKQIFKGHKENLVKQKRDIEEALDKLDQKFYLLNKESSI
ncbi:TPA: MerR family transcriptional regulator [Bacillus cereus]